MGVGGRAEAGRVGSMGSGSKASQKTEFKLPAPINLCPSTRVLSRFDATVRRAGFCCDVLVHRVSDSFEGGRGTSQEHRASCAGPAILCCSPSFAHCLLCAPVRPA